MNYDRGKIAGTRVAAYILLAAFVTLMFVAAMGLMALFRLVQLVA